MRRRATRSVASYWAVRALQIPITCQFSNCRPWNVQTTITPASCSAVYIQSRSTIIEHSVFEPRQWPNTWYTISQKSQPSQTPHVSWWATPTPHFPYLPQLRTPTLRSLLHASTRFSRHSRLPQLHHHHPPLIRLAMRPSSFRGRLNSPGPIGSPDPNPARICMGIRRADNGSRAGDALGSLVVFDCGATWLGAHLWFRGSGFWRRGRRVGDRGDGAFGKYHLRGSKVRIGIFCREVNLKPLYQPLSFPSDTLGSHRARPISIRSSIRTEYYNRSHSS